MHQIVFCKTKIYQGVVSTTLAYTTYKVIKSIKYYTLNKDQDRITMRKSTLLCIVGGLSGSLAALIFSTMLVVPCIKCKQFQK